MFNKTFFAALAFATSAQADDIISSVGDGLEAM